MRPLLYRLLPAALPLAACLCAPAVQGQAALPLVEGFEGTGTVPAGWTDASFGELVVRTGPETRRPHEGKGAWRIHVPVWDGGLAQLQRAGIPLKAGTSYTCEVWLRGEGLDAPVNLGLRAGKAPFTPHLARQVTVGPAWRRYVVEGTVTEADPAAALVLSFGGSGTLYVDALRLVEGTLPAPPAAPAPPPVKGNRLCNSSFELGMDGWTIPEEVALLAGDCPDGQRFARWIPGQFPLEARPFRARAGQAYTVSAYLRSQRPGAKAQVALVEVGNEVRQAQTFDLTPEWKRYSFTTSLPCGRNDRYFLTIAPAEELHSVDVDAVQVEEGLLADYAPATPVEVSAGLARRDFFPLPDEALAIPIKLYAKDRTPQDILVRCRLESFYGGILALGTAPVKAGVTHYEAPLRIRMPGLGLHRLVVEAVVGGSVVSTAEANLTALPALDPKPNPNSFFGAHGSVGSPEEWHAPGVAARAGVRWWRLHDFSAFTQWAVAEPQQDQFVWYDREVDALRSRGLTILGVLARTAPWAGVDPGGERADPTAWPPARMCDFSDYVRQVVTHYRGKIAAYELWNEPWTRSFWAGTPEQYTELAKAGAQAARAADPGVRLVGGSFWVPRGAFTDRVLAKGLLPAVNAVSHHHYTDPESTASPKGEPDQVTAWYTAMRGKLNLAGGEKVPLWNTEGGVPCPSYYSWLGAEEQARAAARALAKTLILNKANGVQRYFYYHVWQERGGPRTFDWLYANNWTLLDYDGSGKPTLAVYAACAQNLDNTAPVGRVETEHVKAYVFRRGMDSFIALWSPTALQNARDLKLALDPVGTQARDLMGNPKGLVRDAGAVTVSLRNEPTYLHVPATPPARVLEALRAGTGA